MNESFCIVILKFRSSVRSFRSTAQLGKKTLFIFLSDLHNKIFNGSAIMKENQ